MAISLNSISVNTRLYEREYCRAPKGRGVWAFSIGCTAAYDDVSLAWFSPCSTTYREAVRLAKLEAQSKGVTNIYVLP